MKKIGLFAILVEVSHNGYFAYVTSGIGLIGLIITIAGCVGKSD